MCMGRWQKIYTKLFMDGQQRRIGNNKCQIQGTAEQTGHVSSVSMLIMHVEQSSMKKGKHVFCALVTTTENLGSTVKMGREVGVAEVCGSIFI